MHTYHCRGEFDVLRNSADTLLRVNTQVFVSCNFCGKPVAYNMLASRNRHFMFGATTAHKPKVSVSIIQTKLLCTVEFHPLQYLVQRVNSLPIFQNFTLGSFTSSVCVCFYVWDAFGFYYI